MAQIVTPLRPTDERPVLALSGGVGGAKLALGLARVLPSGNLTVVANTGDDFEHLGLHISPDIDTLLYTLAGLNNPETGWGRRDETRKSSCARFAPRRHSFQMSHPLWCATFSTSLAIFHASMSRQPFFPRWTIQPSSRSGVAILWASM